MRQFNLVLVGVGSLGLSETTKILIEAAHNSGNMDLRAYQKAGISERLGAVYSILRCGEGVHTPYLGEGEADLIIGLEPLEALRACCGDARTAAFASKERTSVVVGCLPVLPRAVTLGERAYPAWSEILRAIEALSVKVYAVGADALEAIGKPIDVSLFILGFSSVLLKPLVQEERLREVVGEFFPGGTGVFEAGKRHFLNRGVI